MKVVGYGRCSTAEQSDGVSIEVQRRAVERVAEANGWEMRWLVDEGVSGAVPPESRKRFMVWRRQLRAVAGWQAEHRP
jgi:DNA invertase Pin-like site-specific DNA recombinase